jgi:hypothetical protein
VLIIFNELCQFFRETYAESRVLCVGISNAVSSKQSHHLSAVEAELGGKVAHQRCSKSLFIICEWD